MGAIELQNVQISTSQVYCGLLNKHFRLKEVIVRSNINIPVMKPE